MSLNSILLLIFLFIINLNYSFSLWKKSKPGLEDYIIDILFTNSLTIIRCNPYERHILRDITFEKIGSIKCSNRDLFLPTNHIENITLLQWDSTSITCDKKNTTIISEKTYLVIKHKPKNAFKKIPFELIRVGSTGPSKLEWKNHVQLHFIHPKRNFPNTNTTNKDEFITEIYSFKKRPILCRERQPALDSPCSPPNPSQNFSYVCYYKIGVAEPPTVAEMENELKSLPNHILADDDSTVDYYADKAPKQKKSSTKIHFIGGIVVIIIIIIIFIGICFSCGGSNKDDEITRIHSNTSTASNIS